VTTYCWYWLLLQSIISVEFSFWCVWCQTCSVCRLVKTIRTFSSYRQLLGITPHSSSRVGFNVTPNRGLEHTPHSHSCTVSTVFCPCCSFSILLIAMMLRYGWKQSTDCFLLCNFPFLFLSALLRRNNFATRSPRLLSWENTLSLKPHLFFTISNNYSKSISIFFVVKEPLFET